MSKASRPLADRPDQPVVGLEVAARERGPARDRRRAVHPGPGRAGPTARCTPGRSRRRTRTPGSPRCGRGAAYDVPGVVRVLTAEDVPGLNDAGEKHDEPLFPSEVMYYGHAVCWVLGETAGGGPAGGGRGRGRLRAAARADHRARRDRGRELPGPRSGRSAAATRPPGWSAAALPVQRRARDRRPGALLPGDQGRAGAGRRERPDLRPVQHAAPVGDPGHRGARARPARPPGHRAVPADGRRLRRQGVPAARARPPSPRWAPRSPGTRSACG